MQYIDRHECSYTRAFQNTLARLRSGEGPVSGDRTPAGDAGLDVRQWKPYHLLAVNFSHICWGQERVCV